MLAKSGGQIIMSIQLLVPGSKKVPRQDNLLKRNDLMSNFRSFLVLAKPKIKLTAKNIVACHLP